MKREELAALERELHEVIVEGRAESLRLPTMRIEARVDPESANDDERTLEVSFSSEFPHRRWWGYEVLGHDAGEVDTSRLEALGGLPFRKRHWEDSVGIAQDVRFEKKRGRAVVRFGSSDDAIAMYRDAKAGIRPWVSAEYRINTLREIKPMKKETKVPVGDLVMTWTGPAPAREGEGPRWFRVTSWTPTGFASEPSPADPTVGFGRSDQEIENLRAEDFHAARVDWLETRAGDAGEAAPQQREEVTMLEEATGGAAVRTSPEDEARVREEERRNERTRIAALDAVARKHEVDNETMRKAIDEGWDVQRLQSELFAKLPTREAARAVADAQTEKPEIGMSRKEIEEYSIGRALLEHKEGRLHKDSLEARAHAEVAKKLGAPKQGGLLVPFEVLGRGRSWNEIVAGPPNLDEATRTAISSGAGVGADLIGTQHMPERFVDILRNTMVLVRMGATELPGMVQNLSIPRLATDVAGYHVAEGSGPTESAAVFDNVDMGPTTVASKQPITRRMLLQATPAIDSLIVRFSAAVIARQVDQKGIAGDGTSNTPTGILNTGSVGVYPLGTNGGVPDWRTFVELEQLVAVANALPDSIGYITSNKVRGWAKRNGRKVAAETQSFGFIWERGDRMGYGDIGGYPALASNQVPDTLTKAAGSNLSAILFGDYSEVMIPYWGALEVKLDEATLADSGGLYVRAFLDYDIGIGQPSALAVCKDANVA